MITFEIMLYYIWRQCRSFILLILIDLYNNLWKFVFICGIHIGFNYWDDYLPDHRLYDHIRYFNFWKAYPTSTKSKNLFHFLRPAIFTITFEIVSHPKRQYRAENHEISVISNATLNLCCHWPLRSALRSPLNFSFFFTLFIYYAAFRMCSFLRGCCCLFSWQIIFNFTL